MLIGVDEPGVADGGAEATGLEAGASKGVVVVEEDVASAAAPS